MANWLYQFWETNYASDNSSSLPSQPPSRLVRYAESPLDGQTWRDADCSSLLSLSGEGGRGRGGESIIINNSTTSTIKIPVAKEYLVIAPVDASFNASSWLTHPKQSNFDLAIIYYGGDGNDTLHHINETICGGGRAGGGGRLCKYIWQACGPKWRLVRDMATQHPAVWKGIRRQYKAIMVADDDLIMDTCVISRSFEIHSAYHLLLSQPSLCAPPPGSPLPTWYPMVLQSTMVDFPVLRLSTFVEIMAPIFETHFFFGFILPSLYNAYTGWGLDFIWPFLLRYPRAKIAVIDEVCMQHPGAPPGAPAAAKVVIGEPGYRAKVQKKKKEHSLYSAANLPYSQQEEEHRREVEYQYFPSRIKKDFGFSAAKPIQIFGMLHREKVSDVAKKLKQAKEERFISAWTKLPDFKVLETRFGFGINNNSTNASSSSILSPPATAPTLVSLPHKLFIRAGLSIGAALTFIALFKLIHGGRRRRKRSVAGGDRTIASRRQSSPSATMVPENASSLSFSSSRTKW